ncbi:acetyl-CoA carboxylase biotin carboxyl carrier protein subunit [Actinophytocola xinjiangensis]|uniref:Acetyl-CoA carboxylase biotin carboxyl carrier protein subunit n=1 Tax=Actinophytocola xinjiangensis TaxID=485602 RepID=A0A7Z0WFI0_9PSEU|nr:acyl-CoA carboxylase subunit epsilon [Actinophytocola xinjiangensis]OLF04281.1 acetyl-CoA carboxylase biotin carboxyl carrier protein subunit [Actinophytocola xinjiangensis]
MSGETERPALRVVRGEPTDAEVVALVTALAAVSAPPPPAARPRSRWADRAAGLRAPLAHGPDAWRAATRRS